MNSAHTQHGTFKQKLQEICPKTIHEFENRLKIAKKENKFVYSIVWFSALFEEIKSKNYINDFGCLEYFEEEKSLVIGHKNLYINAKNSLNRLVHCWDQPDILKKAWECFNIMHQYSYKIKLEEL